MMNKASMRLIVFFEAPFWVGLIEQEDARGLCVARYVFGSEPTKHEIEVFLIQVLHKLTWSSFVESQLEPFSKHYKRRQREARKQLQEKGVSTKSQQAMNLAREEHKLAKKSEKRLVKKEIQMLKFEKKQQKKKEKHKGR